MARIRSIHPGLFTDEAFMSASAQARVFMIGIWCEAFDDGVFEWKPVVLKARILPADNIDATGLLDELVGLNVIKRVERNGRPYGLIRNFRKFQRPKKPNSSGILIASDDDFVGKAETASETVPNQCGTSSEIPSQMEDGGDKRKEDKSGVAISPAPSERAAALKAIEGPCLEIVAGTHWPVTTAQDWHALTAIVVEHRLDPETELLPSIREQVARKQAKRETVRNWGYFVPGCLSFAAKAREPPKPFPEASSSQTHRNGARNDPRNTQTPMQRALDALKPRGERPIGSSDGRTIDGEYQLSAH
jgi:hypothetical protein